MRRAHLLLCVFLFCASSIFTRTSPVLAIEQLKVEDEARLVAENYWNAQKTSDDNLFSSVTALTNDMKVVFSWSFVRESNVQIETVDIEGFREEMRNFMISYNNYKTITKQPEGSRFLVATLKSAKKIEINHPKFGEMLSLSVNYSANNGNWNKITPANFADLKTYKLMSYEYMADVEFQSQAGTTLKKRTTIKLRRLIADDYDSEWKVFSVT